jgi:restriction system protein
MPVPDYQTLMLPLLRLASDRKEHSITDAAEQLAKEFRLSEADLGEMLPSGRQTKFKNRVGWARTYMKMAGLLEAPGRGRFRITPRGLTVLQSQPSRIDVSFLSQFPEFMEFREISREATNEESKAHSSSEQTPEEVLDQGYQVLRRQLAQDLLERVKKCSPSFFEQLVVNLLVAMGYGGSRADAGQAIGRSGDGGIDGTIKEDRLGLDIVYVQAKRWESTVSRSTVQAFAGSLEGVRARKGVLITTSDFSKDAKEYAATIEKKIVLINGEMLVQLMIDHNVGVSDVASYAVKKIDLDYFDEDT